MASEIVRFWVADPLEGMADPQVLPAQATREQAEQRAGKIRTEVARFATKAMPLITEAYLCRDWAALEYESWDAYYRREIWSQVEARLSRSDRLEITRSLKSYGASTRAIAAATGVTQMQARRDLAEVRPNVSPATVTGFDGKQYPASRPSTPEPAPQAPREGGNGGAVTRDAGGPAPRVEWPKTPAWDQQEAERRAAITNLRSVLTYLVSQSIPPQQLAEQDYAVVLDEFEQDDLDYAAATMAAIAALKRSM